ncbi:MAG: RidA family protein [Candidatus Lokiarchaeota archaeon]|nr:RidA family protein [Candidatus Lokiarchaeota archaeon]
MVDRQYINPGTPVAGPYTPAVIAGDLIFVSGQIPSHDCLGIRDQTTSALEKIKFLLESCGSKVENIVKTTIYLKNLENFKDMNESYKYFFLQNGVSENFPARSTVQAIPPVISVDIEIEAIAVLN